jgi:hypothetical protein
MIVQMATTAMIGYTVLIHIQLYFIAPAFVMIPTLTGMVLFYLIRDDLRVKQEVEEKKKSQEKEINALPMESVTQEIVPETTTSQLSIIINHTRRQSMQHGLQLANQVNERILHTNAIIHEEDNPRENQEPVLLGETVNEEEQQQIGNKTNKSLESCENSDFDENPDDDDNDFQDFVLSEAKAKSEEKQEEEEAEDEDDEDEDDNLSFRSVSFDDNKNNSNRKKEKKTITGEREEEDTKKNDERQEEVVVAMVESRSATNENDNEEEEEDEDDNEHENKTNNRNDNNEDDEDDDYSDFIFTPSSSEDDDDEDD